MDFQQKLEEYAELVVKVGLNIQKDQPLINWYNNRHN